MAATQNPNEMRLEELKAIKAKIAAEEARLKAEIAAEKAAEEDAIINAKADAQLIAQARGLEGERDEDGTLIPVAPDKGLDLTEEDHFHFIEEFYCKLLKKREPST